MLNNSIPSCLHFEGASVVSHSVAALLLEILGSAATKFAHKKRFFVSRHSQLSVFATTIAIFNRMLFFLRFSLCSDDDRVTIERRTLNAMMSHDLIQAFAEHEKTIYFARNKKVLQIVFI